MAGEGAIAAAAAEVTGRPVEAMRALTGGISNLTYLVRLAPPGEPRAVVARLFAERERARNEAAALGELERGGIRAPRLLGERRIPRLGSIVVSTRVPGRSLARPDDARWLESLADTLAAIHRVPRKGRGLRADPGSARGWISDPPPQSLGPVGSRLWPAIRRRQAELDAGPYVLVHGDFHAGNVHWVGGRVSGVIDWEMARWGPRAADVAYCYLDLALAAGKKQAEDFLAAYVARGGSVPGFDSWLLLAMLRPLPDPAAWLPSYEGAGYRGLTPSLLRRRLTSLASSML
jgi:Ser/Thr protein kinase RdoA (MazF antagonist)